MEQLTGTLEARPRVVIVGAGYAGYHCARYLGFVVDLGGWQAVADPLHIPLSGPLAQLVTRAYHLYALPANRLRVATDWFINIIGHHQLVQLGLIASESSGLAAAEDTGIYYQTDGQPLSPQRQESTT